ncbi:MULTISPECIES: hypothetical protein [unclassified Streptomyces]|uniref:hypothetical protein n=1 Tax=unclassified Streptomyces TaxID=2593676 RepID=UPI000C27D8B5|nr:hypothetical protein [Streptomyces sp. CB02959]PJN41577.1 hypothetical protein CG747_07290 [Streptomyces sp. CB02959]
MDPELPVVRLCVAGMQAEAEGRAEKARELFQQAWDGARDDYEACVAAHYLARHQSSPAETLRWNQECLDRADLVGDERVQGFYPSLYVNLGNAYRELGRAASAHRYFVLAAERVAEAPEGQYGDWNRFAIAEGLRDTAAAAAAEGDEGAAVRGRVGESVEGPVRELFAGWCERGDLKALALTLPAYLGYLGTDEDRVRLRSALHMVHAARWLPEDEQAAVERALGVMAMP